MSFAWPQALLLLLLLPLFVVLYVRLVRRRRREAMRYANLSLVRHALAGGGRIRRHLPPLIFLLGLTAMLFSVARPTAVVSLPSPERTILLVMDVSGSMRATDVAPDRLRAAQAAAKRFVEDLPRGTRVGVVSFAATAAVVQQPTQKREDVLQAIDRFQLQRGTAIGSGLLVALATLFPDAGIEVGSLSEAGTPAPAPPREPPPSAPVPAGSHVSGAIILLTDGQRTTGPETREVAAMATKLGVRVYTVGIGTPEGEVIGFEGWSMRVRLDEDVLKAIARETRGEYFQAGTADELERVYDTLGSRMVIHTEETEISALFAAAGAGLTLLAALLSLWWFNRIL